jgi:hypothetical protein
MMDCSLQRISSEGRLLLGCGDEIIDNYIDKNSLSDGVNIDRVHLYVNEVLTRYGQWLSRQKTTSCGAYDRKKIVDYISEACVVIQDHPV